MFRLSRFMEALVTGGEVPPRRAPPGPVVIWNVIRRCNLTCRHCYSLSNDTDFKGELSTEEALAVLDQLKAARVPAVIFSGGSRCYALICRCCCAAPKPWGCMFRCPATAPS